MSNRQAAGGRWQRRRRARAPSTGGTCCRCSPRAPQISCSALRSRLVHAPARVWARWENPTVLVFRESEAKAMAAGTIGQAFKSDVQQWRGLQVAERTARRPECGHSMRASLSLSRTASIAQSFPTASKSDSARFRPAAAAPAHSRAHTGPPLAASLPVAGERCCTETSRTSEFSRAQCRPCSCRR